MSYLKIARLIFISSSLFTSSQATGQDEFDDCGTDPSWYLSDTLRHCSRAPSSDRCKEWLDRMTALEGEKRSAAQAGIACAQMCRTTAEAANAEPTAQARKMAEAAFKEAVESHRTDWAMLSTLSCCCIPDRAPLLRRAIALKPDDRLLLKGLGRVLEEKGDRESLLDAARLYKRLAVVEPKMRAEAGGAPFDGSWPSEAMRIYESLGEKKLRDEVVETLRSRLARYHEIARNPTSPSQVASSAHRRVCDTFALQVVGVSECIETIKLTFDRLESNPALRSDLVLIDGLGDALDDLYSTILSRELRVERSRFAKMFLEKVEGLLAAGIDLTVLHVVAQDLRRQIEAEGHSAKEKDSPKTSRTNP